ncbi:hypothetical protein ADLECEL_00300 [Adlercreutzia equolifaciens subsp. celatus]|uniref:FAD-dependent oxidoreductase 2 FAD-binding domain-containing protein n=2 Tax=Adlercreutzia equolifaciens TaxID=446660 RepID=A0A3N0AV37_9ACTN|nr:fumarate reductase flavoprotein subunit [Adlercreutzia equolifaciens subsp. celatus DSM 18785]RFT94527.1 FAD-binding protein [Adlercreutzia equolifaciens subsp. celatus]RNL38732.1 hypothetical protein DMP10_04615 [Adlercreutzia equolifaciens subsp. celatus DSM 18785]BCS56145.1 hypothetical protein ADLECEL_00300 [Adlercreutzia equolifaciens subsp. celatus]
MTMELLEEKRGVDRRNFIKGGAMAAGALGFAALAGCAPKDSAKDTSMASTAGEGWDDEADVVVIGLGGGMAAVLAAVDAGATVIGIEKGSAMGGNWAINTGVVFAPATDAMKNDGAIDERTGAEDTIDSAVDDWIRCAKGNCNPDLVRAVLTEEQSFINSLVADGVNVKTELCGMANAPIARGHYIVGDDGNRSGGGAFTNVLAERVNNTSAKILLDTTAKRLILDDAGNVRGVEVREGGKGKRIAAKAVVVATGGYTANQEMRARWNPESAGWGVIGSEFAQGDGYEMLLDCGASFAGFKTISPSVTLEKNSRDTFQTNNYQIFWETGAASLIMLDSAGKRNRSETQPYTQVDGALLTVPNYQVFDQTQLDDPNFCLCNGWSKESLNKAIEDGWVVKADTAEELAQLLYLDPEVVSEEIKRFNEGAAAGTDAFGRPADTMRALQPPYYAATGTNGISGTDCNCLKVDDQARVLDRDGDPINGIYGGGNDMYYWNWAGSSYIASGGGAGAAYGFSVIAGRNAAAYALSEK